MLNNKKLENLRVLHPQIFKYSVGGALKDLLNPYMQSTGLANSKRKLSSNQLEAINNFLQLDYGSAKKAEIDQLRNFISFEGPSLEELDTLETDFKDSINSPQTESSPGFFSNMGNALKAGFNGLANNLALQSLVFGLANTLIDPVENNSGTNTAFAIGDLVSNMLPGKAGLIAKGAMLGLKAINSIGGKRSDSFSINLDTLELVGGSYGGSVSDLNNAASKAGKKYGLFSNGSRRRANREIAEAKRQQRIMTNIAEEAETYKNMAGNEALYAGYEMNMSGGYDLRYMRAAKHGMKLLDKINLIRSRNFLNGSIDLDSKTIIWEPVISAFQEGGSLKAPWEPIIPEFQEGGKTRTLEELIAYAKKENPRFIQRLSESPHGIEFIDGEGNKGIGNVYLEWGTDNKGNAVIYPRILEMDDKSLKFLSSDEAWERANKNNNILIMSPEEAQIFFAEDTEYLTAYKRGWPKMFKNYSEKAALQNNINLDIIHDYYKNHDLSGVEFIIDESPRTEGKKLYIRNEEDAVHELWHLLSQNKPNEKYIKFYDNLNDDRIIELGGDLKFVKRFEGDPGHFYHPSELEARIKAAKFKTQGQTYTKEFFQNLRKDENKYGDNMRDLLHMYNDENLEEIFNLKKGGALGEKLETPEIEETTQKNVIPEGALHKNKHHMEHAEGLTKKGIPVIDEDGDQLAEIELNEIIFTLEVTKKLEELYKKYYSEEHSLKEKNEFAIDAGKLLVKEILFNTKDRTGLISKCEKGGVLNGV